MGVKVGPRIIQNGLILDVDAAVPRSYSGTGLTANGLIGGIGGTLVNGTGFGTTNNGFFIFDGTTAYLYVNGILATSEAKSWDTVNNNTTYLGRQVDNGQYWNGHISQAQLYNRALTAQEILQNYNATKMRYL